MWNPFDRAALSLAAALFVAAPAARAATVQDTEAVRGAIVQVLQFDPTTHQVTVNGRPVLSDDMSSYVTLAGVYQGAGRAYVLIKKETGGNGCPAMYQVLDLSNSTPLMSTEFGTCDDVPKARMTGATLRVTLRSMRGGTKTFAYTGGHVRS